MDEGEGLHDDTEHCDGAALAPTSAGGMGTHATPPDDMDAVTPGNTSADPSLKEMDIGPWYFSGPQMRASMPVAPPVPLITVQVKAAGAVDAIGAAAAAAAGAVTVVFTLTVLITMSVFVTTGPGTFLVTVVVDPQAVRLIPAMASPAKVMSFFMMFPWLCRAS